MKHLLRYTIIAVCILLSAGNYAFAQNLIQNGNFTATTASWITSCTNIEATYYESTYGGTSTTNHVAEVDDESCFHQDVCVLPGASYTFSMQASRRTSGGPASTTTHINIVGLDATGATVATYVNMDFTRTNTTFAFTAVTGIPVILVASGSGVVRLRVTLTDNTTGYSTLGMIVDNLSLVFTTPPAITGPATATTCQNVATTFSVANISTGTDIYYNWTFTGGGTPATSTSATPSVTWATAGTATATVGLGNGTCYVDTVTYSITINAASATTVYDTICSNSSVIFGGNTLTLTGTYTTTLSNIAGCDSVVTLNLLVKPEPVAPVISGTTFYCQGATFVSFTVTGTGILWYTTPTGGTGTAAAPVVPTATPGTYTYYASQVVNGCESARASITVTVNATPAAPTVNDVTYCQFTATVPLTATGTGILWYTTATGGTGSATAPTPSSAVAGVFTWYVSQTINTCEGPRSPITATIYARPGAPVITNSPGAYCRNQTFNTWTIVAGSNILWYTAATGGVGTATAPVVNTAVPGTYTYWASQTVNGCEGDRSSVTVTVYSAVSAAFTSSVRYGCKGDTVSFTNNSVGGVSYLWDFGDGSSSTVVNPVHVYVNQNLYTIKLFTHSATCVDSNIQTLDLRHADSSAFTIVTPLLCQGSSTTFTNQSVITTPGGYEWNFGDGSTSGLFTPSHTYTSTGIYTVSLIVTNFIPCKDTSYAIVTVDSSGSITLGLSDTILCQGTYITMNADYLDTGLTSIAWNMDNGDSVLNVNPVIYAYHSTGTFVLSATARYRACPTLGISKTVTVLPQPLISLGKDTAICAGSDVIILHDGLNPPTAPLTWLWNTGATSYSIAISSDGTYAVTAALGNCYTSDTVVITNDCYASFPNVFSPNADGLNDFFNPRDYFGKNLTTFKMDIYNRWGQLIFETDKTTGRGWDGNFNSEPQPQGVYIYTILATFGDGQKVDRKGNLTLVR